MASEVTGKLDKKVALITGGGRGIGKAIAAAYAREGAKVFICGRSQSVLEKTAAEIRGSGGEIAWRKADITKFEDVKQLVRKVCRAYGTIDILVNNASILGPRVPIVRYPLRAWEKVVRTNLTALFMVTREVLKVMVPHREGSVINVSSGVGRVGKARWAAYAVSKFGVEGFTQVLADEMKDYQIRVNAVNPGGTRTAMRAKAYPDEDPLTLPTPEEITGVFVYLASAGSQAVTGKSFDGREWSRNKN